MKYKYCKPPDWDTPYRVDPENPLDNWEAKIEQSYCYHPVQQCSEPWSAKTKCNFLWYQSFSVIHTYTDAYSWIYSQIICDRLNTFNKSWLKKIASVVNRLSHLLDDTITQAGNYDKHTSQSSLHSRQYLSKHHRTFDYKTKQVNTSTSTAKDSMLNETRLGILVKLWVSIILPRMMYLVKASILCYSSEQFRPRVVTRHSFTSGIFWKSFKVNYTTHYKELTFAVSFFFWLYSPWRLTHYYKEDTNMNWVNMLGSS